MNKKTTLIIAAALMLTAALYYIIVHQTSKAILDDFVFTSDSLKQKNDDFEKRTDSIVKQFEKAKKTDSIAK